MGKEGQVRPSGPYPCSQRKLSTNPSTSPPVALLDGNEKAHEERQEVEDRLVGQCEVEAATMAKGSKAADVSAAIEELIASAMDGAKRLEGSNPGLQPGDSQTFHFLLHECVKSWRQGLEDKPRLADVGNLVTAVLEICGNDHCRPQPMANRRSMFPLFAPGQSVDAGPTSSFLPALIASLNHLHGVEMTGRRTQTSSRAEKGWPNWSRIQGCWQNFYPLCVLRTFSLVDSWTMLGRKFMWRVGWYGSLLKRHSQLKWVSWISVISLKGVFVFILTIWRTLLRFHRDFNWGSHLGYSWRINIGMQWHVVW
jgi:hypothetical protein